MAALTGDEQRFLDAIMEAGNYIEETSAHTVKPVSARAEARR
jgi:hypothetical protein